ncbi:unnamed protein product [Bursaphelenchus okinawaensis]|uniref:Uncharacterized protein n=1 Tax=Bursaphelenchus okinawaensis TaxID=465554 RepID=A0A811LM21_9BILA|nr:unnamed protein product [Bursaphelenchus okinawaensis]CAG9124181.1 unnamed protein product [Bursaphelenchus okinawaensis]
MFDSVFMIMTEILLVFGALLYLYNQYQEEKLAKEPPPTAACTTAKPIVRAKKVEPTVEDWSELSNVSDRFQQETGVEFEETRESATVQ